MPASRKRLFSHDVLENGLAIREVPWVNDDRLFRFSAHDSILNQLFEGPPPGQIEGQLHCQRLRQWYACSDGFAGAFVELELLPHDDLKPSLTIAHDSKHLLVGATRQKRLVDQDWHAADLRLAPDAIEPAGLLLQGAGVPTAVVMDYVPAEAVQVDALAHHTAADQDFGE
ncbi:MAG TPA: hypothetical protein VMV69_29655 [Pirellulales bacterium]|nr:hypothetical protein [Pirellulales bacterium]